MCEDKEAEEKEKRERIIIRREKKILFQIILWKTQKVDLLFNW